MRRTINMLGMGVSATLLGVALTQTTCQSGSDRQQNAPIVASFRALDLTPPRLPVLQRAGTSSVMVYVKLVIEKKYGVLAHLFGGMRDNTWEDPAYDPAHSWWNNPLIAYADPPFPNADVIGRADAQAMTGQGVSGNAAVHVTLVPHADVSVKTIPRCDGIRGTITTTISTAAEYYDGHWAQTVHEDDKQVTFSFDTCDPLERLEAVAYETRTIPTFALERYTRDQEKWEPKRDWPEQAKSGDWRVVIYGKDATLEVTSYRYVKQSVAEARR